jgi:N-acetyl-anhydromuramyl-L-alanine amidase AmpD
MEEKFRGDKRSVGSLYYPMARIDREMPTQGFYQDSSVTGYPLGAVIHYTASGSSLYDIDHGIKNNLCYWLIAEDGTVFQTAPLNRWGWHAGPSSHPELGTGLSSQLLGIEVDCPGKLDWAGHGWRTWYGTFVREEEVNVVDGVGYKRFTSTQEHALERVLVWLKLNNPSVFDFDYVLGHSEITPRKADPGGSLVMGMDKFRGLIKDLYKNELKILGV